MLRSFTRAAPAPDRMAAGDMDIDPGARLGAGNPSISRIAVDQRFEDYVMSRGSDAGRARRN